jgi:hypothetical protein
MKNLYDIKVYPNEVTCKKVTNFFASNPESCHFIHHNKNYWYVRISGNSEEEAIKSAKDWIQAEIDKEKYIILKLVYANINNKIELNQINFLEFVTTLEAAQNRHAELVKNQSINSMVAYQFVELPKDKVFIKVVSG